MLAWLASQAEHDSHSPVCHCEGASATAAIRDRLQMGRHGRQASLAMTNGETYRFLPRSIWIFSAGAACFGVRRLDAALSWMGLALRAAWVVAVEVTRPTSCIQDPGGSRNACRVPAPGSG